METNSNGSTERKRLRNGALKTTEVAPDGSKYRRWVEVTDATQEDKVIIFLDTITSVDFRPIDRHDVVASTNGTEAYVFLTEERNALRMMFDKEAI